MSEGSKTLVSESVLENLISRKLMDLLIRFGLITFLVLECYLIIKPFVRPVLWSVILAVALYPLHTAVTGRLGGRAGRGATVLVLAVLIGLLVPATLLAMSFADSATELVRQAREGTLRIPAPPASVAAWPVVGEKLTGLWSAAHTDLGSFITQIEPRIEAITKRLLGYAASTGTAMLTFLFALILAGVWMAYGTPAHAGAVAVAQRIFGTERGDSLVEVSTATIRAVAQGVIGIACIQAVLLGAGFVFIGIPGAGVLALLVLILGIMQIPAALVSLPAIVYVFMTNESTTIAILFAAFALVAGTLDNILKPLILARGAGAPMPVILLGALGGMATEGIIGLFLGAVLLALAYRLLMSWVYYESAHALRDG